VLNSGRKRYQKGLRRDSGRTKRGRRLTKEVSGKVETRLRSLPEETGGQRSQDTQGDLVLRTHWDKRISRGRPKKERKEH